MELEHVLEHHVAERYLAGQLPESEVVAFEELLIVSEEARAQLGLVRKMRQGFESLADQPEPRPAVSVRECRHLSPEALALQGAPPVSGPTSFLASPRYALAATFLLVVFASTTGLLYLKQASEPLMPLQTSVYSIQATRSGTAGEASTTIPPGTTGSWTVLLLDPGPVLFDQYRVVIARASDVPARKPIFESSTLTPGYQGLLSVGLPGQALANGEYQAIIEGVTREAGSQPTFTPLSTLTFRAGQPAQPDP